MNRFNHLLNTRFSGCRQLGYVPHVYDGAPVNIYAIPDHPELVGYNDGRHSWISCHRGEAWEKSLLKPSPTGRRKLIAEPQIQNLPVLSKQQRCALIEPIRRRLLET